MDIPHCFANANVLITGATGFLGLCLIEKLLRSLPDIGTIYILIRSKKNKSVHMRLTDLLLNKIFNTLKERKANLNFNEDLRSAIHINVLGTRRIVELCKKIENLKALIHVSSAYVNSDRKDVKEIIYPISNNADKIIGLIDDLDDASIDQITPVILDRHPNTYTFTKALAEREIISAKNSFPTAIIRPSMITGAWKEPVPGWTVSKNGPQGFLMAAAKGIVRRLPVNKHIIYDYIPVDIVVNEMISSAWYISKNSPKETMIYHCTTSTYKPFKWLTIEKEIPNLLHNYPLQSAIWYPTLKLISSMKLFQISAFIFHMIPAYFLDILSRINGQKPVFVKLHKNINRSLKQLSPFIFNEWKFDNTNSLILHRSLTSTDKEIFGIDLKDLVWSAYFNNLALGVRQYLNNESIDTLPAAKKKDANLWILNMVVQYNLDNVRKIYKKLKIVATESLKIPAPSRVTDWSKCQLTDQSCLCQQNKNVMHPSRNNNVALHNKGSVLAKSIESFIIWVTVGLIEDPVTLHQWLASGLEVCKLLNEFISVEYETSNRHHEQYEEDTRICLGMSSKQLKSFCN
ncbi:putative fatty acyl-CoA reductase CG8306 [Lycorma delicatula]|uniref:putative fatty acyl-CoA reductase CG8306 n=1 Tax=Lycorma delicatula TaxID=130591 RepID=UPI003F513BFB